MKQNPLRFLACALAISGEITASHAGVRDEKPVTMDELVVSATKTHTLFMGTDIAVNFDKDLYPVRDVFGSNWVIDINGQQKEISSKQAPLNLKITPTLKLTEVSASILGLRREPGYSFDNDPSVRITRGLTHAASTNADLKAAGENALNRVFTMMNRGLGGAAIFAGADDQFSANALLTTAKYSYSDLHSTKVGKDGYPEIAGTAPSAMGDPLDLGTVPIPVALAAIAAAADLNQAANGNEPVGRLATMGLDAMDIEFDITSNKPLNNPYVVTITRFSTPGAKPGQVQNLVYARAINPIDSHLSHVQFSEDGFPFNYQLIEFQLHIYDHGVEVATNISPNRVELTRDEAFEYVKMEYLSTHHGSTLPAVPVMGQLPADFPTKMASGKYGTTYYVRVSKNGIATEAFLDAACTKKMDDPYVMSIVGKVRFKPALNEGKPVEAVAPFNLSKLTI